jgi:hypothetical protein
MNTMPDYYNRLTLFIAKMIEDGSYDAHTLVDGYPHYDPTLDKRFSKYFQLRANYKDSQGNYTPASNDVEYNTQRRLYLLLQAELNEERMRINETPYTEEDLVSHAYSEKERLSFTLFSNSVYGYYDKDSQAA